MLTAIFLVHTVTATAVYDPVTPRGSFDASLRPTANRLVALALQRGAVFFVRAVMTVHHTVADCRRIVHARQSCLAIAHLFVRAVLAVYCPVTAVVQQHNLCDSGNG